MRVAVAGAGDMAKYIVEELLAASHEVVVLSRSQKPWFSRNDIIFRQTDYSPSSLAEVLQDCEGLISSILDYSMNSATVHLALLEACQNSPRCKRFVPSEYAGNVDQFPEEPAFYFPNHDPVRQALRRQTGVMWTLFNLGWLTDYLVPAKSRYIKDIGDFHPVDLEKRTITIPGDGKTPITFTAARDGAKALARLIDQDNWEASTYVSGSIHTWNDLAELLDRRGLKLGKSYRSHEELLEMQRKAESEDSIIIAEYGLWSTSGAGLLPQDVVKRQSERFFCGLHIRSVDDVLDDAEKSPDVAV